MPRSTSEPASGVRAETAAPACPICGHGEGNRRHAAREMMFGLRHPFTYGECGGCGLLWLLDPPADFTPYYPADYYSFRPIEFRKGLQRLRFRSRVSYGLGRFTPLGRLEAKRGPMPELVQWFRHLGLGRHARILDVGCGRGQRLVELREAGFRHLLGVDPYVEADVVHPNGVRVLRREIDAVDGSFDLVMFHHVFEHLAAPVSALRQAASLLASGGAILIRIPVADSWAWRHFGPDWVQLDPPRHLFLHTRASMNRVAESAGLTVTDVVCDERPWAELASRGYVEDIPLRPGRVHARAERQAAAARAAERNRRGEGDQAAFYLRRKADSPSHP